MLSALWWRKAVQVKKNGLTSSLLSQISLKKKKICVSGAASFIR